MTEKTKEQLHREILIENNDFMYRVHPEYYLKENENYAKRDFAKKVSDWEMGMSGYDLVFVSGIVAACVMLPIFALGWWFH
jgi:hypothetical protein